MTDQLTDDAFEYPCITCGLLPHECRCPSLGQEDGGTTPADPAVIDVANMKERYESAKDNATKDPWNFSCDEALRTIVMEDHPALIAAVEALRERVVELAEALERTRDEDYAAGLEAAAEFHEKYAAKAKHKATGSGVLAQKMSWHNWSAKAIRALGKEKKKDA